jgi:predicted GIY-YIG superfamily endonuclease
MTPKYLKMIRKMKPEGKSEWSVYLLRCGDGSLYTGIAKDVAARIALHRQGKGAAYTRTHLPVDLIYQEARLTRSAALVREAEVKRWPRKKKEALVISSTPIS